MAYTTKVVSKQIEDGVLKVVVRFTKGTQTFTNRFETRSGDDDWLDNVVARRLDDLENITSLRSKIIIGSFTPERKIPNAANALYREKIQLFRKLHFEIQLGLIDDTDVDYVTLKLWLQTNFRKDI